MDLVWWALLINSCPTDRPVVVWQFYLRIHASYLWSTPEVACQQQTIWKYQKANNLSRLSILFQRLSIGSCLLHTRCWGCSWQPLPPYISHFNNVCYYCMCWLTLGTAHAVMQALVACHLDYWNGILADTPQYIYLYDKHQSFPPIAARLIVHYQSQPACQIWWDSRYIGCLFNRVPP